MKFSARIIQDLVREHYQLECSVHPLAGHVDFNYLLKDNGNSKYLLKICKPEITPEEIQFQVAILHYLENKEVSFDVPSIISSRSGKSSFRHELNEIKYSIRMHTWVEGRMLSEVNPRTSELYHSWGETCGELSSIFQDFDHLGAHRFDDWNPVESLSSKQYMAYFDDKEKVELAEYFWDLFEKIVPSRLPELRKSVNYSDAHEHNLLTDNNLKNPRVTGVIDFGDAVFAPTICELAIACAYAGMYVSDPIAVMSELVKGYHSKFPILDEELEVLFPLICGRLMITLANAAYNFHKDPENEYHQISAKPAFDLLRKLRVISPQFAHYSFRSASKRPAHPNFEEFLTWKVQNLDELVSPINMNSKKTVPIDLSVGSLDLGNNSNFDTVPQFTRKINELLDLQQADVGIGGYGEIRPFYTTDAYKVEGNNGPQWRTMHLGLDYWTAAGTDVLACWDGEIHSIKNNNNPCDYGPTIIIKHNYGEGLDFYTLYGHLSLNSLEHTKVGQKVSRGEVIGWIGEEGSNGGWPPHLHFQVMLDLLDNKDDFPGVCFVSEANVWLGVCPMILEEAIKADTDAKQDKIDIQTKRSSILGKSLSLSYEKPLHMVRGSGAYLYDNTARRYLDTVNNVAHVGHEHPRVVRAAQRQIELLNTNTRYLHENIVAYAERLLSNCPDEMSVVYFVNSGSEANELALRMVKTYTSQKDIVALEAGYHGNTGACVDVSSYKFDGKGGKGAPEFTSICRMPDTYRGRFKNPLKDGKKYAEDIANAIKKLKAKGRSVAGFIAESILSCGGQIVLPDDYLKECYQLIRAEGGLCIADEVQVGFGRVGSHFWAFELQEVVPDIITCGKPIGNGHPLAAVITTKAVADSFTNGMEYFNTFGGSPVSCAIGNEVLAVIEDENFMQNAKQVGTFLLNGLSELKERYKIIGDVRGVGLFLGFELVKESKTLEPAPDQAAYLVNRMRELGILMSTDGPLHNVIKIKPPMCITIDMAKELLMRLDQVFAEDFMSS